MPFVELVDSGGSLELSLFEILDRFICVPSPSLCRYKNSVVCENSSVVVGFLSEFLLIILEILLS